MLNIEPSVISEELRKLFPDAKCELDYNNVYELCVAVILSAQTTDKSVNKVTPNLFKIYPTIQDLSKASVSDVEMIISSIGLSKRKSVYIIDFAKTVINNFGGVIPSTIEELTTIPGIGRKTANVVVSEGFRKPGFAVDVHVSRVSKRLGLVSEADDPHKIELKLKSLFPIDLWHIMHHRMIFMGRYLCKSLKPLCNKCPFVNKCLYTINDKKPL